MIHLLKFDFRIPGSILRTASNNTQYEHGSGLSNIMIKIQNTIPDNKNIRIWQNIRIDLSEKFPHEQVFFCHIMQLPTDVMHMICIHNEHWLKKPQRLVFRVKYYFSQEHGWLIKDCTHDCIRISLQQKYFGILLFKFLKQNFLLG